MLVKKYYLSQRFIYYLRKNNYFFSVLNCKGKPAICEYMYNNNQKYILIVFFYFIIYKFKLYNFLFYEVEKTQ